MYVMNCTISCSFGEVVDKMTILKIKQTKATNPIALSHIEKELTTITTEIPQVNTHDMLFEQLSQVNKKLWILEDLIREKSKKHEFDNNYINYAESIHIENDNRYRIKKQINEKYNSHLKEEKIYSQIQQEHHIENHQTTKPQIIVQQEDITTLEIGKQLYTNGEYSQSMTCIQNIMDKYKHYNVYNSFYIDLLFSYSNICEIFNKHYIYFDTLKDIMKNIDTLCISDHRKISVKVYTPHCVYVLNTMNSVLNTYIF